MKKVLFATTALVASAGVAAAGEIVLKGGANMGVYYDGSTTIVKNEIDFDIVATGETPGGLMFGASMDIDGAHNNSVTTQAVSNDPEVWIETNGLKLTVGNIGEANDIGGISDVGFDGLGVDDVVDVLRENGHDDVRVDYSFGDIAVAASFDSANDEFAVSVSGSFDQFTFAAAYRDNGTGSTDDTNLTVGYSTGAIAVNATYAEGDVAGVSNTGYGLDLIYTQGDLSVTAAYAKNDTTGVDAMGLGLAYSLGGGATVAGGVADVNGTTVADLGMNFSF